MSHCKNSAYQKMRVVPLGRLPELITYLIKLVSLLIGESIEYYQRIYSWTMGHLKDSRQYDYFDTISDILTVLV